MIVEDVPGIPTGLELLDIAVANFKLDLNGIHGREHWISVTANAQRIVKTDGGDLAVVTCFGMLHDCCRIRDSVDIDHGRRASELILKVRLGLDPKQLRLLFLAIREHSEAKVSSEPTIGACWDADRLELPRVDCDIDPEYLSTTTGLAMCQDLMGKV